MATRKRTSPPATKRPATKRSPKKAAGLAAKLARKQPKEADASAPPAKSPAIESDGMWLVAVRAAQSKKAEDVRVLDLREGPSIFSDFFVICTGNNPKQVQAIAEEIDIQLAKHGERAKALEGFQNAEWILADYGDLIVHVFSPKAREYYQLERLWNQSKDIEIPPE